MLDLVVQSGQFWIQRFLSHLSCVAWCPLSAIPSACLQASSATCHIRGIRFGPHTCAGCAGCSGCVSGASASGASGWLAGLLVGLLAGLLAPCWLCWLCFGRIGLGRLWCVCCLACWLACWLACSFLKKTQPFSTHSGRPPPRPAPLAMSLNLRAAGSTRFRMSLAGCCFGAAPRLAAKCPCPSYRDKDWHSR